MLIDWFTVAAQLVNFLLLLWLLKRFLYQPVLKALDERERKIASELKHAADVEAEAAQAKAEWQHKNDAFEQERQLKMKQATDEAGTRRNELLEKARHEYETLRSNLLELLKREELKRTEESQRLICDEIFSLSGKLLTELADQSLEASITDKFCRKLEASGSELLARFAGQNKAPEHAVIRTTFSLAPEQQKRLNGIVSELLHAEIPLSFEQSVSNGCGIELCLDDYCVTWHFQEALHTLKQSCESNSENKQYGESDDAG